MYREHQLRRDNQSRHGRAPGKIALTPNSRITCLDAPTAKKWYRESEQKEFGQNQTSRHAAICLVVQKKPQPLEQCYGC